MGTQGQLVHRDGAAIAEFEAGRLLAQCKVTVDLDKSKNIEVEVGAGQQQGTTAAVHVEVQTGASACGHRQQGFATGVINHFVVR